MKICESYGIITDKDKSWDLLCDIITDYIFDIKDGMQSNPFYNEDE